ncbi:MAG: hypothetical protein WCD37_19445 [Chloroflexia bacterium]
MNVKRIYRIVLHIASALIVITGISAHYRGAAPAQAQANTQNSIPFLPIAIENVQWVSGGPYAGVVGVSGDWAAYALALTICGHCGTYISDIYLRNVVNGRKVHIKPSYLHYYTSSEVGVGASEIKFASATLVWKQPDGLPQPPASNPRSNPRFTPGDFACGVCYYDTNTGKGGEWTGSDPQADPPGDYDAEVIHAAYSSDQPDIIRVTQRSTGKVVANAQLEQGVRNTQLYVGTNKVVFSYAPTGLPGPTLIKVAWLTQPSLAFNQTWAKADQPVAAGKAARSWLWGPAPIYIGKEAYAEGQGGQRLVEYFDKSRMEINNPAGNANDPYYVTNGLLTVELIGGEIQVGDTETFTASVPCTIPVAGDPRKDNPLTPGYSALMHIASLHGENQAQDRTGQPVSEAMDAEGNVSTDAGRANLAHYAAFVPQTGHNIPNVFLTYLNSMKSTYEFDWVYVMGYPITEGYWTQMRVSGRDMPVLVQAYQRRVLTYVPDFPAAWRVQQGNVGQHYLEWRYLMNGMGQ